MGLLTHFILALTNLIRHGAIKNVLDSIKFTELPFVKIITNL
mgnify:CR=1 FL=1